MAGGKLIPGYLQYPCNKELFTEKLTLFGGGGLPGMKQLPRSPDEIRAQAEDQVRTCNLFSQFWAEHFIKDQTKKLLSTLNDPLMTLLDIAFGGLPNSACKIIVD